MPELYAQDLMSDMYDGHTVFLVAFVKGEIGCILLTTTNALKVRSSLPQLSWIIF